MNSSVLVVVVVAVVAVVVVVVVVVAFVGEFEFDVKQPKNKPGEIKKFFIVEPFSYLPLPLHPWALPRSVFL